MAHFCSVCGTQLADDARFCNNCGTPCGQVTAPAPQGEPVYQQQAQPAQPMQPGYQQPMQPGYQQPMPPAQQPQRNFQPITQPRPQPYAAAPDYRGQQPHAEYVPLNSPQQKSHMGLGVGVTVGIVVGILLIITGIILFIVFNPFGWGNKSKEDMIDMMVQARLTDRYDADDLLPYIYEYEFAGSAAEKQSLRETAQSRAIATPAEIAELKEEFGNDYKITTSVTETEAYTGERLEQAIRTLSAYEKTDQIEEIVRVSFSYTIKGSYDTDQSNSRITLIKVKGKWYFSTSI